MLYPRVKKEAIDGEKRWLTAPSWIRWRSGPWASSRTMDVHFNVVPYLPNRIDGDRPDRGKAQDSAGPQIETRAVPPAFDDTVDHVALRQPHSLMSALVVHGAHLAAGAYEADGDPLDDHPEGRVLRKVAGRAGTRPGQRRWRMSLAEFAEWCRRGEVELRLKAVRRPRHLRLGVRTHEVEQLRSLRVGDLRSPISRRPSGNLAAVADDRNRCHQCNCAPQSWWEGRIFS